MRWDGCGAFCILIGIPPRAVPVGWPWSRGAAGDGFVLRANSWLGGRLLRWVAEEAIASLRGIAMLLAFPQTAWGERRKSPLL